MYVLKRLCTSCPENTKFNSEKHTYMNRKYYPEFYSHL